MYIIRTIDCSLLGGHNSESSPQLARDANLTAIAKRSLYTYAVSLRALDKSSIKSSASSRPTLTRNKVRDV